MRLWPFTRKGASAQAAAEQALAGHPDAEAIACRMLATAAMAEDYCPSKGHGQAKASAVCQFILATHPDAGLDYDRLRHALDCMVQVLNEEGWPGG